MKRKGAGPDEPYEYVLKVRGITLNYDVMVKQGLHYESFKQKVQNFARTGKYDPIKIVYPNFLRPSIKKGGVNSVKLQKIYRPYVAKGIVSSRDYSVLNFGHVV